MKYTILFLVLVGVLIFVGCAKQSSQEEKYLKIGAILPLSGPAAIWGESIRNGMELAKQELTAKNLSIKIIYEDSQAKPSVGLSAYNKLVQEDHVNMIVSAFSRVSVPLISLVNQDRVPLVMTLVSAKGVTTKSPYAFRFYSPEKDYAAPSFEVLRKGYTSIGLLYLNDEYGTSVAQAIRDKAVESNILILIEESFEPETTDFRTQLLKIKRKNPQALLFVGAVPVEVVNAVKQVKEMQLSSVFFEASPNLGVASVRETAGKSAEGVFTLAYPFTLGSTGIDFTEKYRIKYGEAPLYTAGMGYDMAMLVAKASESKAMTGSVLVEKIMALNSFDSTNGPVQIQPNREINPPLYVVKIVNGSLVRI